MTSTTPDTSSAPSAPEDLTNLPVEEPENLSDGATRAAWTTFRFDFRQHHGYEKRIRVNCHAGSVVLASICEVGVFGGQVLPFQGAASMDVDNVVPHNDGTVIIRGGIGWDSDVNARLNILVAS